MILEARKVKHSTKKQNLIFLFSGTLFRTFSNKEMKRSNSKENNTNTISTKKARFNDNNNKQKLSEKLYGNYNAYYT